MPERKGVDALAGVLHLRADVRGKARARLTSAIIGFPAGTHAGRRLGADLVGQQLGAARCKSRGWGHQRAQTLHAAGGEKVGVVVVAGIEAVEAHLGVAISDAEVVVDGHEAGLGCIGRCWAMR